MYFYALYTEKKNFFLSPIQEQFFASSETLSAQ